MAIQLASIQSDGDLEVVVLHESHGLLADIISPDIYGVAGAPPDQNVFFHSRVSFAMFLVHLTELLAEGARSALIAGRYQNWSLLRGLSWLCARHASEAQSSGLTDAVSTLDTWLSASDKATFWCPDVSKEVTLVLPRQQIALVACNTTKHHLLRLGDLIQKLNVWSTTAGYNFSAQELAAVLTCMAEEVRGWMEYHSTYLIELLGRVFAALNKFIRERYAENSTNDDRMMRMPEGITSDVFRGIYGSVLVFKRYHDSRILSLVPVTGHHLKGQYR
jgi:hypothetical protein